MCPQGVGHRKEVEQWFWKQETGVTKMRGHFQGEISAATWKLPKGLAVCTLVVTCQRREGGWWQVRCDRASALSAGMAGRELCMRKGGEMGHRPLTALMTLFFYRGIIDRTLY